MDKELVKYWLSTAKETYEVTNYSQTSETALSVNVFSIPNTYVTAVTVTILKNHKKKVALPACDFAKVMRIIEQVLFTLQDTYIDDSDPGRDCYFVPVDLNLNYWKSLECHRLFFIPPAKTADFYTQLITKQRLTAIKSVGITEVYLKVHTPNWDFELSL